MRADFTKLITMAARWPASSMPTNIHALSPMAYGLIWRSRWLLCIRPGTVTSR
jgi:hypothetical protein